MHSRLRLPLRGISTLGTPAPLISAIPTARRCRAAPAVPGPNAARRISSRNRLPRSGSGSRTTPSGPTSTGADAPPSAVSRTRVGRRTPGAGSSVSVCSATARGVPHSSHACRPSSHEPTQGRAVPSNALDARNPGRPSKRADALKMKRMVPRPTSRSKSGVLRVCGRRRPAVDGPGARRGRRKHPLEARSRRRGGRGRAPRPTGRAAGRAGRGRRRWCAGTGRSDRCATGLARPARARRAPGGAAPREPSGPRSRARGCRPHPPSGPPACAPPRSARAASSRRRSPTRNVFQPRRTANRRPCTSTAVTVARRSLYGSRRISSTSRGSRNVTSSV